MVGSLSGSMPKAHKSRVQIDPGLGASTFKLHSTINLDFTVSGGRKSERKSSFLPSDIDDDDEFLRRSTAQFKYISGWNEEKNQHRLSALHKNVQMTTYLTGSKYIGQVNQLGMAGKGIYKFPHGPIYDGYFNKQGEFHGSGSLIYPGGQRVEGIWKNGKLVSTGTSFVASDNSKFDSNYCEMPDRRFQIELDKELQAAGREFLTNDEVPRPIPPGMYDTGYGFYDPKRKVVISYQDPEKYNPLYEVMEEERKLLYKIFETETEPVDVVDQSKTKMQDNIYLRIINIPPEAKEKWVKRHCRKPGDETVGYRPDLYEVWNPGYGRDDFHLSIKLSKLPHSKDKELIEKFSRPKQKTSKLYSFTSAKIKSQISTMKDHIIEYQTHPGHW